MSRRWAARIGGVLFTVAFVNFFTFFAHSMDLGGTAGNGKREGGRYFVGDHGRYIEVPEWRWRLVWAHEAAVFVTHTLGLLVGAPLLVIARRVARPAAPGTSLE